MRGLGLLTGVEIVADRKTRAPFPDGRGSALVRRHCLEQGLIVRAISDTIALSPPLVISESEVDHVADIVTGAVRKAEAELGRKLIRTYGLATTPVGLTPAPEPRPSRRSSDRRQAEPIVLIAGNDVVAGTGGHPSYVRAHARAARRAGFAPQLFSLSRADGTVETDYGTVHQVGVRVGFERWPVLGHRKNQLVWRYAFLARAVASFVRAHGAIR